MIALALAVFFAGAEPLDDGIALYQSLEFERAAIQFQGVVLDPAASPTLRAQAAMWAGLSLGQLGDVEGARRAFALAVANDAGVEAPPGAPPALCAILEEERTAAAARPPPAPPPPPDEPAPPVAAPEQPGPEPTVNGAADWPAIGSGVAAGALGAAAVAAGVYGAVQYATSADPMVPAGPALAAYDAAVAAGWAAAGLGGVAVVAGGVAAALFLLE